MSSTKKYFYCLFLTDNFQVILQVPVVFVPQTEDEIVADVPDAIVMRVPVEVVAEHQPEDGDRTVDGDQEQGTIVFIDYF